MFIRTELQSAPIPQCPCRIPHVARCSESPQNPRRHHRRSRPRRDRFREEAAACVRRAAIRAVNHRGGRFEMPLCATPSQRNTVADDSATVSPLAIFRSSHFSLGFEEWPANSTRAFRVPQIKATPQNGRQASLSTRFRCVPWLPPLKDSLKARLMYYLWRRERRGCRGRRLVGSHERVVSKRLGQMRQTKYRR